MINLEYIRLQALHTSPQPYIPEAFSAIAGDWVGYGEPAFAMCGCADEEEKCADKSMCLNSVAWESIMGLTNYAPLSKTTVNNKNKEVPG